MFKSTVLPDHTVRTPLGLRLTQARVAKGLTQRQAAKKLGMSPITISCLDAAARE